MSTPDNKLFFKYWFCEILSKITFGKTRRHFTYKRNVYKHRRNAFKQNLFGSLPEDFRDKLTTSLKTTIILVNLMTFLKQNTVKMT